MGHTKKSDDICQWGKINPVMTGYRRFCINLLLTAAKSLKSSWFVQNVSELIMNRHENARGSGLNLSCVWSTEKWTNLLYRMTPTPHRLTWRRGMFSTQYLLMWCWLPVELFPVLFCCCWPLCILVTACQFQCKPCLDSICPSQCKYL